MIESYQNPKIKLLSKLKNKRTRDQTGLFFVEGYRELLRLSESHFAIEMVFFCPKLFLQNNETALLNRLKNHVQAMYEVSKGLFEKISMRDRPDGLVAIVQQKNAAGQELEQAIQKTKNPFFCIAEAIEKPGNLGSILRSCDATAVTGLIVCDPCTDVFNPNVVRASIGTLFTVPIFQLSTKETITLLQKYDIHIVTTSPQATKNYTQGNYQGGVAIAVGTEQLGLSEAWFGSEFEKVFIPMKGHADSLNVSNATTLLLYEVLRQRI